MKFRLNKRLIIGCFIILFFAICYTSYKFILKSKTNVPKVSVVVPVYNSEKYLPQCLDSIINQTYKDLEIICVNDGSKDNSWEILTAYKKKYPQFVLIDKPNGGVSSARNSGLRAATGKYVQFMDSDDLIHSGTIKNLVEEAEAFNADIVRFNKSWFNKNEFPDINKALEHNIEDAEYYFHEENENPFARGGLSCNVIHDKFYKRDFLINNNLFFDEEVRLGEDSLFCWMSFIRTSGVVVDKNVYYYHRTDIETSLMGSSSLQKWFDNHMKMIEHLIKHKNDFKFEGYKEFIMSWAVYYGSDIFNFGSSEEKSNNAKLFFSTIDGFLLEENVVISDDDALTLQKLRNLIID